MVEVPWEQLFEAAELARRRAYAPYSKFQVGIAYTVTLASTRGHNLFHQAGTAYRPSDASPTTPSVTDVLGDPLFEDAALRVTASSPAVNAGTGTGAPVTALGGTTRPQGAAVDIGAHERSPANRPAVGLRPTSPRFFRWRF